MIRSLLILLAIAFALPGQLAAQTPAAPPTQQTLMSQKVEITADTFVLDEQTRRATFTGNVLIKHPVVTVWAPEVVLTYGEGGTSDIQSFEATAKDQVKVRLKTKDQDATGNQAVFAPSDQLLTLTGDVVVNNGAGIISAPALVVDLIRNTSIFTGRVTGTFGSK